jgi:hypothetical protein
MVNDCSTAVEGVRSMLLSFPKVLSGALLAGALVGLLGSDGADFVGEERVQSAPRGMRPHERYPKLKASAQRLTSSFAESRACTSMARVRNADNPAR